MYQKGLSYFRFSHGSWKNICFFIKYLAILAQCKHLRKIKLANSSVIYSVIRSRKMYSNWILNFSTHLFLNWFQSKLRPKERIFDVFLSFLGSFINFWFCLKNAIGFSSSPIQWQLWIRNMFYLLGPCRAIYLHSVNNHNLIHSNLIPICSPFFENQNQNFGASEAKKSLKWKCFFFLSIQKVTFSSQS